MVIVGAGPVGLAAALHLAKLSYDVHVHEKREDDSTTWQQSPARSVRGMLPAAGKHAV